MPSGTGSLPGELARSVAGEVRAELSRRGLPLTALDGVGGRSHNYVWKRLSPRATLSFNLNDLSVIAEYLGMTPLKLLERARANQGEKDPEGQGYGAADEAELQRLADKPQHRVTKPTQRDTRKSDR